MKNYLKIGMFRKHLLGIILLFPFCLFAQEGEQTITLNLTENDSSKVCKAIVTGADMKPAAGIAVNFYIERSVGLFPISLLEMTDENGEATCNFPTSIPGDTSGKVTVIAQLEDDEAIQDQKTISWGTKIKYSNGNFEKALWASRSNAPTYFIIVSNAIILAIWGTMGYIFFLLVFRVKKSGIGYDA